VKEARVGPARSCTPKWIVVAHISVFDTANMQSGPFAENTLPVVSPFLISIHELVLPDVFDGRVDRTDDVLPPLRPIIARGLIKTVGRVTKT